MSLLNPKKNLLLSTNFTFKQMESVAKNIISYLKPGTIVALQGPMGSGKTSLVKKIIELLEVKDMISSPTYSYLNRYQGVLDGQKIMINHADLYRVGEDQLEELAILDFLYQDTDLSFVEWPAVLQIESRGNVIFVSLDYTDDLKNQRNIIVKKNYE
jgi:tRNA threonylcarbamoyladenosine biosynthesis protein TsaE